MSTSTERSQLFRERKRLEKLNAEVEARSEILRGGLPTPNLPEIEEIVIGTMLIDPSAVAKVISVAKDENLFYSETHQKIYEAIYALFEKNEDIDRMTVYEKIVTEEMIVNFNPYLLVEMSGKVSSSAHVESHARLLLQCAICRKVILFSNNLTKKAYQRDVFGCLEDISDFKVNFSQAKQIHFEAENFLEFCPLFPRNRITTIFAPPKAGKTAVLFSIMHALAEGKNFCFKNEMERAAKVLYCDCEMSDSDYKGRGWLKSPIKRLVTPPKNL